MSEFEACLVSEDLAQERLGCAVKMSQSREPATRNPLNDRATDPGLGHHINGGRGLTAMQQTCRKPLKSTMTASISLLRQRRVAKTLRQHRSWISLTLASTHALDCVTECLLLFWAEMDINGLGVLLEILPNRQYEVLQYYLCNVEHSPWSALCLGSE